MFKKKCVFITGVGKGSGEATFNKFSKKGFFIYGITRSKNDLKKFKSTNSKIYSGDVRNIKLIKKIFDQSIKDKRLITGLVNNAGIRQRKPFLKIKNKNIKELFDINFFSIFEICKIYVNYCKKFKIKSSVINIGSIVGEIGFNELSGYSSSKGALKSLTQSLAVEFSKENIRFNLINPGFVKSSYFPKFKKKRKLYDWTLSRIPQKRWGTPEEISSLIYFLISDESEYINGESINIDGGWLKA